eukprot:13713448-Alexandrium_andersonii.AAC.1
MDCCPSALAFRIVRWAKYLGVCLGLEGAEHHWVEAIRKFGARVDFIRGLALGLPRAAMMYASMA